MQALSTGVPGHCAEVWAFVELPGFYTSIMLHASRVVVPWTLEFLDNNRIYRFTSSFPTDITPRHLVELAQPADYLYFSPTRSRPEDTSCVAFINSSDMTPMLTPFNTCLNEID